MRINKYLAAAKDNPVFGSQLIRMVILLLVIQLTSSAQDWKTYCRKLESTPDGIILSLDFSGKLSVVDTQSNGRTCNFIKSALPSLRAAGEPWLPALSIQAVIPSDSKPEISIISAEKRELNNVFILPYPDSSRSVINLIQKVSVKVYSADALFPENTILMLPRYTFRFANVLPLSISPVQFNPVQKKLTIYDKLTVKISFNRNINIINRQGQGLLTDKFTSSMLEDVVINPENIAAFMSNLNSINKQSPVENIWYDASGRYAKLYLKDTAIYRVSCIDLAAAGISAIYYESIRSLQLFANGGQIPIDIQDLDNDGLFNNQDYIQFVGLPAPPSEYCTQNIYNNTNVYWLKLNGDPAASLRYSLIDGTSGSPVKTQTYTLRTDFYERDSIYERLGHAQDEKRDFWFWRAVSIQSGMPTVTFAAAFNEPKDLLPDSPYVQLKVKMHGMTSYYCGYDHHAIIKINGRKVGEASWNGQEEFTFTAIFNAAADSIPIYHSNNFIAVTVDGNTCRPEYGDEIRVNWFELSYLSEQKTGSLPYRFQSLPYLSGPIKFTLTNWTSDSVRIYSPENKKMITRAYSAGDSRNTITFNDTITGETSYYAAAPGTFRTVDSIRVNMNSDLRNSANGADYIIIAHRKFSGTAEQLKQLRSVNFPDTDIPSPRLKIVYVDDIYNEFSDGLMNPAAIKDFIAYAFSNWAAPAPSYVVLIGDMSSDYRHIFPESRNNYIPSLNIMSYLYGIAANDNGFVCITSNPVHPDLCLGRISIETEDEGSIIIDKLRNYPADKSKTWRGNVLMYASGENLADEAMFGFNDSTLNLRSRYLLPYGFNSTVVFNYPDKPSQQEFKGSTAEMRGGIDNGGILLNYYGHGGGFQWDRVFMDTDIYKLNNPGRLPLVLSVTCYTAHFDNYDIFGEQFLKVPNKGCIGFFGSAGLTNWEPGTIINNSIFDEIFAKKNYIAGKAFMKAKLRTPAASLYGNQIALLTFLGDPVLKIAAPALPDFSIKSSDITISNDSPFIGDSLTISAQIANNGTNAQDSVTIDFYTEKNDSIKNISSQRIPVFPLIQTVNCRWKADLEGQVKFTVMINKTRPIAEEDTTDNIATRTVNISSINSPQIITPDNGDRVRVGPVRFSCADFTSSSGKQLKYTVQIDTSLNFTNPLLSSPAFSGSAGLAEWFSPKLNEGAYFYRVKISDDTSSGNWTTPRVFTVNNTPFPNGHFYGDAMRLFDMVNVNYSPATHMITFQRDSVHSKGWFTLPALGPAATWNSLFISSTQPDVINHLKVIVEGTTTVSRKWDTLLTESSNNINLSGIPANKYPFIRATVLLYDSLSGTPAQYTIAGVDIAHTQRNELILIPESIKFESDTIIVGATAKAAYKIHNAGPADDSTAYYYSLGDLAIVPMPGHTNYVKIMSDSTVEFHVSLATGNLAGNSAYVFKPGMILSHPDRFSFNNEGQKRFFIMGDTTRPLLKITADNRELFNGSSVSPRPEISIEITDNSPLGVPSSDISLLLDNAQLAFPNDSIKLEYFSIPNAGTRILLQPNLKPGSHTLEVQAKDASNNSLQPNNSAVRIKFMVYGDNEIADFYNYPNPFRGNTYFTFHIHAKEKPSSARLKIFTVAGRLVKEINLLPSDLQFDINKAFWNGRDNDGDQVANGTYLCKLTVQFPDRTLSSVQKIVKMN